MNEKELRKRFRRGIAVSLFMGMVVLCISIFVLSYLNRSMNQIVQEQMRKEAREYKRRILRQIDRDCEALESLAVFMDGYTTEDMEAFSQRFYDAKKTNEFITMSYFGTDRKGVIVNEREGLQTNVDASELDQDMQELLEAACRGEEKVTALFDSAESRHQVRHRVLVYSVPVYNDDHTEVTGVLSASNHVEIFEELIDGERILNGTGAVHLVASDGSLLISTTDPENRTGVDNILYSPYYDKPTEIRIRKALFNGEDLFCTLHYRNRSFHSYFEPIDVNGWYIMCISNQLGINFLTRRMGRDLSITFATLFFAALALMIYVMRVNIENNKSLTDIAYKDPLTKGDNLVQFKKNLSERRSPKESFSVVALNIHKFKFINEIMGGAAADRLLVYISERIGDMLKKDEFCCRATGDLFFIFFRDTNEEVIRQKLEILMQAISDKSVSAGNDYKIRFYAGVFVRREDDEEEIPTEQIIVRTRFALSYAKKLHGSQIHFYDADIHKREEMENFVEMHMNQALENGEFHLFLQPKIDLKTGNVSSAEALVRWITADGQMIYPSVFIPQFERNGFCIQLDMYMFEQVCKQMRAWMEEGRELISVSVNQSKLLFFDSNYVSNLQAILEKYGIPASKITLEILESLVLEHAEEVNGKLRRLRSIGFKISMDDFGSGYSSFNTLGSLEIDELKIDRAFLLEVSREKGDRYRKIMEHIVDLTKSLQIDTVVEGVETLENEALIQSLGCDYGQGYLYSRPISAEEFSGKFLKS